MTYAIIIGCFVAAIPVGFILVVLVKSAWLAVQTRRQRRP